MRLKVYEKDLTGRVLVLLQGAYHLGGMDPNVSM